MKCLIFTHPPDYPLARIATKAWEALGVEVTWAIEASHPAPPGQRRIVTKAPRNGNLNGKAFIEELLALMAGFDFKADSDTLPFSLQWAEADAPLVGFNRLERRALYGCCWRMRREAAPLFAEALRKNPSIGEPLKWAEDLVIGALGKIVGSHLTENKPGGGPLGGWNWSAQHGMEAMYRERFEVISVQRPPGSLSAPARRALVLQKMEELMNPGVKSPVKLILRSNLSPGDIVMMTAAVRDLHAAFPGKYLTDARTPCPDLWKNNPHITKLEDGIEMPLEYPLIHQSNSTPHHFIHGYRKNLEEQLGVSIPQGPFKGDIHLTEEEKAPIEGIPEKFWVIVSGGKRDFTAKWWDPDRWQSVVDHFSGRIQFVQVGEKGHHHPALSGVIDMRGKTTLRELARLVHHSSGVLCPVTSLMHLAAAVPTKTGRLRPCVVVAGGREPSQWEQYPGHRYLDTIGSLDCCANGGCWKSRVIPLRDGDKKDESLCVKPVSSGSAIIPRCLDMISAEDVIRAVESYYPEEKAAAQAPAKGCCGGAKTAVNAVQAAGRLLKAAVTGGEVRVEPAVRAARLKSCQGCEMYEPPTSSRAPRCLECGCFVKLKASLATESCPLGKWPAKIEKRVLIRFSHGLGDAVQLTIVLKHLAKYRPSWVVDVASGIGKHSAFFGLCRSSMVLGQERAGEYDEVFSLGWFENYNAYADVPNTKVTNCLREVFKIEPDMALMKYEIQISEEAKEAAREYLASIGATGKAVAFHYQGNTSPKKKNLPEPAIKSIAEDLAGNGYVPVILDWDGRSGIPNGKTIHCPGAGTIWGKGNGSGDAQIMAALISQCSAFVGIDSGPGHIAGATNTPSLIVWVHHQPVQFFDLCGNVTHLIPKDWRKLPTTNNPVVADVQARMYQTEEYHDIEDGIRSQLRKLGFAIGERRDFNGCGGALRATTFGKEYYEEHKAAGLDYAEFGDWQRGYGRWFVESLKLKGKRVLDLGCACGAILRGIGGAGAIARGCDINPHSIQVGREKWPDMAPLLDVAGAGKLPYHDHSFDAIHCAQVAEHWKPEDVPGILREIRRVLAPGGIFWCALDTVELYERQGRKIEDEDPTHWCVKPMQWWRDRMEGFAPAEEDFRGALQSHPEGFLRRYDWDWFCWRAR